MLITKSIDNDFGNDGIVGLCDGLEMNKSLRTLYLRSEMTFL